MWTEKVALDEPLYIWTGVVQEQSLEEQHTIQLQWVTAEILNVQSVIDQINTIETIEVQQCAVVDRRQVL